MPTSMELVERLYRRLVEAAAARDGGAGGQLTIADLYQHLIPYRGVRGELGVLELAEYEHALLRLLVGEGGYLRLLNAEAQRELAAELAAPNPILGVYRDYAASGVELIEAVEPNGASDPAVGARPASADDAAPDQEEDSGWVRDVTELIAEDVESVEDDADGVPDPLPEITYPPPRPFPADATRVARTAQPAEDVPREAAAMRCASCRQPLPDVEDLRFCPHCGADQTEVPCERCGAPIRSVWNFCIRCGAPRPQPPS